MNISSKLIIFLGIVLNINYLTSSQHDSSYIRSSVDVNVVIIGAGGCGGNIVTPMREDLVNSGLIQVNENSSNKDSVSCYLMNTDLKDLYSKKAENFPDSNKVKLGETGRGAGANPEIGRLAAEAQNDRIKEIVKPADVVIVILGGGAGTGSGAGPVIAKIAKDCDEKKIIIGVIVSPEENESSKKIQQSKDAENKLLQYCNSVVVISNDNLSRIVHTESSSNAPVSLKKAYDKQNKMISEVFASLCKVITGDAGLVHIDHADLTTIIKGHNSTDANGVSRGNYALMSVARSSELERGTIAAQNAIKSPLLKDLNFENAFGVLINLRAGDVTMDDKDQVLSEVKKVVGENVLVIWGAENDPSMVTTSPDGTSSDALEVTLLITGLKELSNSNRNESKKGSQQPANEPKKGRFW